jgi:hypothetical protein
MLSILTCSDLKLHRCSNLQIAEASDSDILLPQHDITVELRGGRKAPVTLPVLHSA